MGKEDNGEDGARKAPGWFGAVFDFVTKGPAARVIISVGVALVLLAILRGVPKWLTLTTWQSVLVGIIGVILAIAGIFVSKNGSNEPKGARELFDILLWAMLGLGIAFSILTLVTYFYRNYIPESYRPRADLDEVLIALGFASLCGFLPPLLAGRHFRNIPKQQKAFLDELEKSREEMVSKVEDATRSMLKGFPQVFDKALWMIKNAEQELFFVNFAANFGAPHVYNREIVDAYTAKYKRQLSDDVKTFFSTLISKVGILPNVHVLTILDKSAGARFLELLAEREGYSKLKPELLSQLKQTREKKRALYDAICAANRASEGDAHERRVGVTDTLPIQLLITQVKKNDQLRGCCLVFMVGTEVIKSDLKPGEEPAFYTELEDMVKVFRNLAKALINSAVPADDEYRELDRQTNQFTYPGAH